MTNGSAQKLNIDELEFSFPESKIRELKNKPGTQIVGQDRAVTAIQMGLGMTGEGYNIFVMGSPGTGRRTVLSFLLKDYKPNPAKLQDIAYAYNFRRPIEPIALFFPAGQGRVFKLALKKAVEKIHLKTLNLLKSKIFITDRKKIITQAENEENALITEFESKMLKEGFQVLQIKEDGNPSFDLIPVIKKKQVSFEELQNRTASGKISEEEFGLIREKYYKSMNEMTELFEFLRDKRIETDEKIKDLQKEFIKPIIKKELKNVLNSVNKYRSDSSFENGSEKVKKILEFLKRTEEDLISRMNVYSQEFKSKRAKKYFMGRYLINLICDNGIRTDFVITENMPSFTNLFGTIESASEQDDRISNGHLKIREGAVHRAFGGYLILRFQDLVEEEDSWIYLKRILQSGKIEIQMPLSGTHSSVIFKPEALPADFKVIIIGGEYTYDILYQEDPDFYKLNSILKCKKPTKIFPLL